MYFFSPYICHIFLISCPSVSLLVILFLSRTMSIISLMGSYSEGSLIFRTKKQPTSFDYSYQNTMRQAIAFGICSFVNNRSYVIHLHNKDCSETYSGSCSQMTPACKCPGTSMAREPSGIWGGWFGNRRTFKTSGIWGWWFGNSQHLSRGC